jgi:SAM-dependent methyltransferase
MAWLTGTEEYYRARAREYDQVYDKPERQADLARLRTWLPPVRDGRRVLEVAAGTGYWTAAYADRAAAVIATDISAETLSVARARRAWPATVCFAAADAFALTSVRGAFDTAFAWFFWSHIPVGLLDGFLAGLARRLDYPATLVFTDNCYVPGSNHPLSRSDADGNTYQRRQLSEGRVPRQPVPLARRARQQPGGHDLNHLADGRGKVQAQGSQRRIRLIGREHRGGRLRMRPQRGGHHDGGACQPEGIGLTELGQAPEHQDAERGDGGHAGPLVPGGDIR